MPTIPSPDGSPLDLVSLTGNRTPLGLTLEIRSPIFEEFFRTLYPTPNISNEQGDSYGGVPHYALPNNLFSDFLTGNIRDWGSPRIMDGGRPNISCLRAVGLGRGVQVTIRTPISTKLRLEFISKMEMAISDFYLQYIRPEAFSMEIVLRSVTERAPDRSGA